MKFKEFLIENLLEMKLTALSIEEKLNSPHLVEVQNAMREYSNLADRFYGMNEYLMVPQQHIKMKQDFEYFIRSLDLAIHNYLFTAIQ